jgi:hypothetical protein
MTTQTEALTGTERRDVVHQVIRLLDQHYVFPEVAAALAGRLSVGAAEAQSAEAAAGHLSADADLTTFAAAVTAELQSVNGDKHLRLIHHAEPLPEHFGEDEVDLAAIREWADATCGGVARAQRLPGNVGYLDLSPLLFPPAVAGDALGWAMSLLAGAEALLIDLRRCLGGDPTMVALACSYLVDQEPVELSGLYDRVSDRVRQIWTLPHVSGRRFGATKPVYVLTGNTTFSGAEHLAYDLQQLGRATIVGTRTRGGAHPRRGFRVHPHLEATIPVARSVSPLTGGNWEGSGIIPDVDVPEADAHRVAYRQALAHVLTRGTARPDVLAEAHAASEDAAEF